MRTRNLVRRAGCVLAAVSCLSGQGESFGYHRQREAVDCWLYGLIAGGVAGLGMIPWRRMRRLARQKRELQQAVDEQTQDLQREKLLANQEKALVETQKQEIERLLRRAEEASRLKSQFLANVSHELRTPMNGVLGTIELVLKGDLSAEQREYLELMRESAESLLGLLNELLDFARVESGRFSLQLAPFSPREEIQFVVQSLGTKALEKGLYLESHVMDEVPRRILGDRQRFRQILLNLAGNAIKFTDRGTVSIGAEMGESELRVSVSDTGVGIASEQTASIFEAFYQVDGSHTRRHGGTGLGLAISKRLVETMGGAIGVQSRPGSGSRFWFTVPAQPASEPPMIGQPPQELPGLHGLRVLVAEDNIVNRKVLGALLKRHGAEAAFAENGREAIDLVAKQQFDVVLMDVQMPEIDGLEAVRLIRERERVSGGHVPVIALTAYAMAGDREKFLAAGMDAYLSKPYRAEDLIQLLAERGEAKRGTASA